MKLISFLVRYSPGSMALATLAGIISGISNVGLLALFNTALKDGGHSGVTLIWIFAGLCVFLPLTKFISENLLTRLAQSALFRLRMQLSRQILGVPLRDLEELGNHRLMSALTEDIPIITNTLLNVPVICINIAIVIGGLIYLGLLSWVVLLAVLVFMAVGVATYHIPMKKAMKWLRLARDDSNSLFNHFRDLTGGIKELKIHGRRREAFLSDVLHSTAASLKSRNVAGMTIYTAISSWGQILVFVVIGLVLFGFPLLKEISPQALAGYTITLLYLMSPIQVVMNSVNDIGRANVALSNVEALGLTLSAHGAEAGFKSPPEGELSWDCIEMIGATHTYYREGENSDFTLGPIDLTLYPGELVFLAGGNGSGKTTLMKLLTGLYTPEAGEVRLNGQLVTNENLERYRQHFSVVFSDFHLFEKLLGVDGPELDEHASHYLRQLQLSHKVEIKDGTLSTTDLSQGQRKRLALLTAYLEQRPIYVFDEWAADQDPLFKKIFYHQILPELKARGKTAVVISHDDRYYDVADRVIKLDYGKIDHQEALSTSHHIIDEIPSWSSNT
jgi:putative pyoverdin transport system ATP-binding/permease protein